MLFHAHNSIHWFLDDFTSRIITETGIPSDRFHFGKILFWSLKQNPTFIMQIDGATGVSETNKSALMRSVRCAVSFKNLGLTQDDVIVLISPNNIDLAIPLYAAMFLGIKVAIIDYGFGVNELKDSFVVNEPKVIFCQSEEKASIIRKALLDTNLNSEIVTFDRCSEFKNFSDFMQENADEISVNHFKPTDFDPESTIALLVSTSGTTGLPKSAAVTHKNLCISLPYPWLNFTKYPKPIKMVLVVSPLQWMSAIYHFLVSPVLMYPRLQSSKPMTKDMFYELVNKYRPSFMINSPTMMMYLLKQDDISKCDISSFEYIVLGGSAVSNSLIETIKKISPGTQAVPVYGTSEIGGTAFHQIGIEGSVGRPVGCVDYRLVDVDTNKDIYEANIPGELWLRGPVICKGYYKNPEATADAFLEDGWFKTGDIFYRDEQWNFYFVERYKQLMKYNNYQISPIEVEAVIKQHPGVNDVAISSITDAECGDLIVACVVPKPGHTITAQEIKDLVKDSLADTKQLRGGVIFMNQLPMTSTTKIHRRKLKQMILTMNRE